jgi:hypothetical protein
LPGVAVAQQPKLPEVFTARAEAVGKEVGAAASLTIHIDKYTDERSRTTMLEALKAGGYQGFLPALRSAPAVGHVEVNGRKVVVRWAREQATDKGRTISIVTERPLFFVGGSAVDAKPREGFELAVIQLEVDSIGIGTGLLAGAARVQPGGATGVQIDDYAEKPVKLVSIRKSYR